VSGEERRKKIVNILKSSNAPVSGVKLAAQLHVSRQVIVQDIALIRAKNIHIFSTNRGYVIENKQEFTRVFKVIHTDLEVAAELEAIVDLGGWVKDVFVFHKVYGVIKANMNIRSRRDIKEYLNEIQTGKSRLLKDVTSGYHYHTVAAEDEETLDLIQESLSRLGFLAKLQAYEPVNFWTKE